MSDCNKYIEMISLMVDGQLSAEQSAELNAHIGACPKCAKVYDAFVGISDVLSDDLIAPPPMLAKGVMYKIGLKKKSPAARFGFGKFTALAACLVLILFGASKLGLFQGMSGQSTAELSAPRDAQTDNGAYDESAKAESDEGSLQEEESAYGANSVEPDQSMLSAQEPEAPEVGCIEGSRLVIGFASQKMTIASDAGAAEIREPGFLFDAKEIQIYEGKYYAKETELSQNRLLHTISTEEELNTFYELITAIPDDTAEYSNDDGEILQSDPLYTLFVPANKEKNEDAKDMTICIWFVDGQVWCLISDAEINDAQQAPEAERILYKAEGVQDIFEKTLEKLQQAP